MRAELLAAMLSLPAPGERLTVNDGCNTCEVFPDGRADCTTVHCRPPVPDGIPRDGGCFLPGPKCIEVGRDLARLRAENEELRKAATGPGPVVIAAALTLVAVVAWAAGRASVSR